MKTALIKQLGGPDVLEVCDIETPTLVDPDTVLVRIKAAGINPVDSKMRHGFYPIATFPVILGCDGAGIVEAIGSQVENFKPGDEVYYLHGGNGLTPGNYAQYTVVKEQFLVHKPETLDFQHAAAAPLVLITAWESLFDRVDIKADDTILVHAGAGGVGHIAIQLAKNAGARVLTTVGSEAKAEFVRQLGADEVILYKKTDFVEAVMDLTQGKGVDIVMDNVGGTVFQDSFPAVRHYGDLISLLKPGDNLDWTAARMRCLRITFEVMLLPYLKDMTDLLSRNRHILQECAKLFDTGKLQIHVSKVFSLDEVQDAHLAIESGTTTGKLVLQID